MNLDYAKNLHRRFLTDQVTIRRYVGTRGPNGTSVDIDCRAHIKAETTRPPNMVADLTEFLYRAVVLAEDLEAGGLTLPLTTADKLVYHGKEMAISFPDNITRSVDGVLVAYNIRLKG